jgi:hypothetical protein
MKSLWQLRGGLRLLPKMSFSRHINFDDFDGLTKMQIYKCVRNV